MSAERPALVDVSHHQATIDFLALRAAGVVGVMHKATQGSGYTDPRFVPRRALALSAGLLYGGYAFGVYGDGGTQAAHLLSVAAPTDLLALDVERNPAGPSMTLAQAEAFVVTIQARTGRWPLVYGGGDYLRDVLKPGPSSVLARCPLWWARYGAEVGTLPAAWSSWTLWQYTSAGDVPGVGPCDCDRVNPEWAVRGLWAA
jgi:lysozyme